MIRLSNRNDISGIIRVWNEAFGDEENDIRFFLDNCYIPENTVVCELDGVIASVLFLLNGEMHIHGADYPSYYLYAACTLKAYRGRGVMASLLDFAKKTASERCKYFIALKPAEDSLYGYYSKFGYRTSFSKKVFLINNVKTFSNDYNNKFSDNKNYSQVRDNLYSDFDYFKWDETSVSFAIKHHKYYGGHIIERRNGYALYSADGNKTRVKEIAFPIDFLLNSLGFAAENSDSDIIYVETPYYYEIDSFKPEVINSGMLLPLSAEAERIIYNINNAYLGLTLD